MVLPNKMKIKTKLILGFSLMLAFIILTSIISLVTMNSLIKQLEQTVNWDARLAEVASIAFSSSISIGQNERDIIFNLKDKTFREVFYKSSWETEVVAMGGKLDDLESILKAMNRSDQIEFIKEAREYLDKHAKGFRRVMTNVESGEISSVEGAYKAFEPYRGDAISMESVLRGQTTRAIADLQKARESLKSVTYMSRITAGGGAVVSILMGIFISIMVAAGIRTPLNELVNNLKESNTKLVSINHELETARKIADLDMRMAFNVQSSFLLKSAPKLANWDISFVYKPMSGVSGDLYDVYSTAEGDLNGVALMDVSGHGISSGLVTMIAKSASFRIFKERYGKDKLSKIVDTINDELIRELGSIDNYLTGIFLKFTGNMVEYVNAGHTELICKKKSLNKSLIVEPTEKLSYKGMFMGLEAMRSAYTMLSFKMTDGDFLLLYTDCLIESVNANDEQYGVERLMSLLNSLPDLSSNEIVLNITSSLVEFTGSDKLKDDLTIIAIKNISSVTG